MLHRNFALFLSIIFPRPLHQVVFCYFSVRIILYFWISVLFYDIFFDFIEYFLNVIMRNLPLRPNLQNLPPPEICSYYFFNFSQIISSLIIKKEIKVYPKSQNIPPPRMAQKLTKTHKSSVKLGDGYGVKRLGLRR